MENEAKKQWEDLQQTLSEELAKRSQTAKSEAEILRGFDDFCREKVAQFHYENPHSASEWITAKTEPLHRQLESATREEDYLDLLRELSWLSPLAKANSECPQYALVPPTMKPIEEWIGLLEPLFLALPTVQSLLLAGFMPIHTSIVKETLEALNVKFEPTLEYTLADTDYGIAVLPPGAHRRTVPLDIAMLQRYSLEFPEYFKNPSDIFDVGIFRGHHFYNGQIPGDPSLLSLDVASRKELDRIVNRLFENSHAHKRYEICFRGQPKEYLLPDIREHALQGICPWRSVQDISLVPSLYRNIPERLANLASYCQRYFEIYKYYLFMKETLGIPTYTTRSPSQPVNELFNKKWGQWAEFSTVWSSADGELIEQHDTHHSFRSLQTSLFLQHYGLESNIVDITNDIDVALFFAQKELAGNGYVDVDYSNRQPVIYVFILDRELDPFVNTEALLEHYDLMRPKRQHCGTLVGASLISKNYYSRFIALRLALKGPVKMRYNSSRYLFPGPKLDRFLHNLIEFSSDQGMCLVKPFVTQQ